MNSILLDVTRSKSPYSGLGQYAIHLGNSLIDLPCDEIEYELYLHTGDEKHFRIDHRTVFRPSTWERENFSHISERIPFLRHCRPIPDVWHTFDQLSNYRPINSYTPVILTIHDLNFPDRSTKSKARGLRTVQKRVNRASTIVTISEYSAQQIKQKLQTQGKEIRVIHSGHCLDSTQKSRKPAFAPEEPFLFSIGEFRSTKNFHLLVQLIEKLSGYHLVLAGNHETDYGKNVIELIQSSAASSRIHLPGKIPDDERRWLYENCTAFLFPSIAEGFGLPVLEAMSCGRPVFTTNEMSLPEVTGPLGFYWETLEPSSMVQIFQEGMNLFNGDEQYSEKLIAHANQFDWKKTARSYLEIYRQFMA